MTMTSRMNHMTYHDDDVYERYLESQLEKIRVQHDNHVMREELKRKDKRIAELEAIIDDIIIDSHGRYGTGAEK